MSCQFESKPHSKHRPPLAHDKAAFLDVISVAHFSSNPKIGSVATVKRVPQLAIIHVLFIEYNVMLAQQDYKQTRGKKLKQYHADFIGAGAGVSEPGLNRAR